MEASGYTHDCGCAIGLTLQTGRFILCRIPSIHDFSSRVVDGNAGRIAFERGDHAPSVIFRNYRDPVAGEICRRRGFRCAWRRRTTTFTLSMDEAAGP